MYIPVRCVNVINFLLQNVNSPSGCYNRVEPGKHAQQKGLIKRNYLTFYLLGTGLELM